MPRSSSSKFQFISSPLERLWQNPTMVRTFLVRTLLEPVRASYGTIRVTLPAERFDGTARAGMRPIGERLASQGVSVAQPHIFSDSELGNAIASYKSQLPVNAPVRLLIFVHGYNVSYKDAAKSAARLAFGLRTDIMPVVISWPSQGKRLLYMKDEESLQTSLESLRPIFRQLLTQPDVDEVMVVGHSMGARLVARVLSQLELQNARLDKLWRIVFAAADISEGEFRSVWPRLAPLGQRGWTFTRLQMILLCGHRDFFIKTHGSETRSIGSLLPTSQTRSMRAL